MVRAQLQRWRRPARRKHLGDRCPIVNYDLPHSSPRRLPVSIRNVSLVSIVMECQIQCALRIARRKFLKLRRVRLHVGYDQRHPQQRLPLRHIEPVVLNLSIELALAPLDPREKLRAEKAELCSDPDNRSPQHFAERPPDTAARISSVAGARNRRSIAINCFGLKPSPLHRSDGERTESRARFASVAERACRIRQVRVGREAGSMARKISWTFDTSCRWHVRNEARIRCNQHNLKAQGFWPPDCEYTSRQVPDQRRNS